MKILNIILLGFLVLRTHLIQALPSVYTLQCLTGKIDNTNEIVADWQAILEMNYTAKSLQ